MSDWPSRPLRALANVDLGRQRSPQHDQGPHMVPYLRAANVSDGQLNLDDVKEMNFSPDEQYIFSLKPGDVLVTEGSGSLRAVGASAVWRGDISGVVCFQNTLLRLRPRSSVTDPRFLEWWCRASFADGIFASIATGANIFHISAERVRALPIRYPPLDAQRAIADFLDGEAARIDALIAKKHQMIKLVNERVDAIIQFATRRGLDDFPIRSSKFSWISEIPTSWQELPLKRIGRFTAGAAFPEAEQGLLGEPIPYFKVRDFETSGNEEYLLSAQNTVTVSTAHRLGSPILPAGTIAFPKIGAALLSNRRRILSAPSCMDQNVMGLTVERGVTRYFYFLTKSLDFGRLRMPGPVPLLNEKDAANLVVPVPPEDEQQRIVNFLDSRLANLMRLLEGHRAAVLTLQERRHALIVATVTGDLDPRGVDA